jgi:predicted amidophosphoribosyltransferase
VSRRLLAEFVAVVAPPACCVCAAPVGDPRETLCASCRGALRWLAPPLCPRCALPAPCGRCPARGSAVAGSWAPLAYEGGAGAVVRALKLSSRLAVAEAMAAQMAAAMPAAFVSGAVLVPVPSARSRNRRRGFEPAAELARTLGARTGVEVQACLVRRGDRAKQAGATRNTRLAEGRIAVELQGAPPAEALLVDDVQTTGATLDACARALRSGGCERVRAVTYARALRGS